MYTWLANEIESQGAQVVFKRLLSIYDSTITKHYSYSVYVHVYSYNVHLPGK